MANHASAKKRVRQTLKRTERNKHIRTSVRTVLKRARTALHGSDVKAAEGAVMLACRAVDRAVSKGVYHRNTGARYIARLKTQFHALTTR